MVNLLGEKSIEIFTIRNCGVSFFITVFSKSKIMKITRGEGNNLLKVIKRELVIKVVRAGMLHME